MFLSPVRSVDSLSVVGGWGVRWGLRVGERWGGWRGKGGEGRWGNRVGWELGGKGIDTFGCVGGLVLAPVSEDFVFDPGHVARVGFVVLFLRPFRHGCGMRL